MEYATQILIGIKLLIWLSELSLAFAEFSKLSSSGWRLFVKDDNFADAKYGGVSGNLFGSGSGVHFGVKRGAYLTSKLSAQFFSLSVVEDTPWQS